jgi:RepB plasmid partitioning protein/ParB-like nuclease domain
MSISKVAPGFREHIGEVATESITPQKQISAASRKSSLYKQIAASLQHVGLIEPLVVFPRKAGDYLLLDGHTRFDILRRTGATAVRVIFATDDEAYTYNKRVNHLPPVAQHFMILKALKNGVSEERIAISLNVNVSNIRQKRDMLVGICPEVVELLRNNHVTAGAFGVLRKMRPIRQIEAAEHMIASGTFSVLFAKALLEVTRPELLLELPSSRSIDAGSAGARALLEQENDSLLKDLKNIEASYGTDILTLSIVLGYIERLLGNVRIERHLMKYHSDILLSLRALLSEVKPDKARALAS